MIRLLAGINIGQRLAHHPFDRDDGIVRVERRFTLGIEAHPDCIRLIVNDRGEQVAPLFITESGGLTAAHCSDERIGGTEIDADGTLVLMGNSALAGFGDLQ